MSVGVHGVELDLKSWEKVVGNLVVEYETNRDVQVSTGLFSEETIEDAREEMEWSRQTIQKIQDQVGQEWMKFVDVGLWDQETNVTVDNRDRNFTEIHIEGHFSVGVSREDLNRQLEGDLERLSDHGWFIHIGLVTLVLYKGDVEYLLQNMDENNPIG